MLNPSNTLWSKQYNLYTKIDTEVHALPQLREVVGWLCPAGTPTRSRPSPRTCSSGDKLTASQLETSDGRTRSSLRNIKSPILVFCSQGDNITPPQQALGWILDLYDSTDDIVANGQTIIYAIHDDIGHLGIFVSGRVAAKEQQRVHPEHRPDRACWRPAWYEAVITEMQPDDPNAAQA